MDRRPPFEEPRPITTPRLLRDPAPTPPLDPNEPLTLLGGPTKAKSQIEAYRVALAKAFRPSQLRELEGLHALCDLAQFGATVLREMAKEAE